MFLSQWYNHILDLNLKFQAAAAPFFLFCYINRDFYQTKETSIRMKNLLRIYLI